MYLSEDFRLKVGLAEMLKGGVIMDVTSELTHADSEVDAISTVYPADVIKDARKSDFSKAVSYEVVHIAAHTV